VSSFFILNNYSQIVRFNNSLKDGRGTLE